MSERLCAAVMVLCASLAHAQVTGIVRDAATSEPLGGARVSIQASPFESVSGNDGRFALPKGFRAHLVVTAAKKGYYTAGVPVSTPVADVELRLDPVPQEQHEPWDFGKPIFCASCHLRQYQDWRDSPMGHGGTNFWVYDTFDGTGTPGGMGGFVYTRDSVHAANHPASECASCHQPETWWQQPFGPLRPLDDTTEDMTDSVSCDVCHKLADIDETKPNFPGLYPGVVKLSQPHGWQVQYGLLGDVDFRYLDQMRASYQPQLAAAVCAACHQDKNDPDEDGEFEEANGIVSEPTYLEWRLSPYAEPGSPHFATCVDCHMKPNGALQACGAITPPIGRPYGDIRSHRIEGTTHEYLHNAVSLDVRATREGSRIRVDATITNDQTGHHVPTGVTIRNMILLVEASTAGGAPLPLEDGPRVHELGGVGNPANGYFAGLPGRLYAKVNHDALGGSPVFFTEATGIVFDSRIPALASDSTSYVFAAPGADAPVVVRARLIYRRSWRFLVDAKGWHMSGHGHPLEDLEPPHFGVLMEDAEVTLGMATDAGAPDAASGSSSLGGSGAAPSSSAGPALDAGAPPDAAPGHGDDEKTDVQRCACVGVVQTVSPRTAWVLIVLVAVARGRRRA